MKLEDAWVGDGHFTFLRAWLFGWGGLLALAGVAAPFVGYGMGLTERELQDLGGLGSAALIGIPGFLVLVTIGGVCIASAKALGVGRKWAWFGSFFGLMTFFFAFWPLGLYLFWSLIRRDVRHFCGLE